RCLERGAELAGESWRWMRIADTLAANDCPPFCVATMKWFGYFMFAGCLAGAAVFQVRTNRYWAAMRAEPGRPPEMKVVGEWRFDAVPLSEAIERISKECGGA